MKYTDKPLPSWGLQLGSRNLGQTKYLSSSSMYMGFPGGSDGKESASHARDPDSVPGLGRSPGEGNGNPLQYS